MWVSPKTDWISSVDTKGNYTGDYFSAEAWNRIKNNTIYLYGKAGLTAPDLGEDKVSNESRIDPIYASDFNKIEDAIEYLRENVADLDTGDPTEFFQNGRAITANELNRIESAQEKYYLYFEEGV